MAALTRTDITKRLPLGDRVIQTFRATTGSADASTEWIATGLSEILGVVGFAVKGAAPQAGGTVTAPVKAAGIITWIATNPTDGDTVTVAGIVYTLKTAITAQTVATHAVWTVTFGTTDMTNGDIITVGTNVYTYATTAAAIFDLDVQGTEATAAVNFAAAINHDIVADAAKFMDAEVPAHTEVRATVSGAVVTLTAIVPGTVGNITVSTTSSTGEIDIVQTVTAVDTVHAVPYEVLISDTEATMGANLAKAINNDGTPGTEYGLGTAANPDVTAADASGVTTCTARVPGTAGNALTIAENGTGITAVDATLSSGADAVADALGVNFVLNAQGTGVSAGTNRGDLGIESSGASSVVEVTVIGRP